MTNGDNSWIANFIWGIADDVLRDLYVRGKYRDVILPMMVLRRLGAVLEPTKKAVLDLKMQLDKAGAPYILHPLRMMLSVDTPEARMAAVLHDVVEDTSVTLQQLRDEGFPDSVLSAVQALTKHEGKDYEALIRRAGANRLARMVKLADLRDNSDLSRIAEPTEKDRQRVEKYRAAIQYLERLG